jgi:hypothetical protein
MSEQIQQTQQAPQIQQPNVLKNVVGVLLFIPSIGIPVLFASVGIRIAGILLNVAGSIVGTATSVISGVISPRQTGTRVS